MQTIIVHGGAGAWEPSDLSTAKEGLIESVSTGINCLAAGSGALHSCEEVVKILEDHPTFNAGLGSVLNLDGYCEMDASIMIGSTREAGACACVRGLRYPITLARRIMAATPHILLVQDGAHRFAKESGLEERDPTTGRRIHQWRAAKEKLRHENTRDDSSGGTVGCIALDEAGEIVVGSSTGGMILKFPGRVGDTPIIGAGIYSTSLAGACATGHGEGIMRVLLAKRVCDLIENGFHPQAACDTALTDFAHLTRTQAGVIALSSAGETGVAYNTRDLPYAYWREGMVKPVGP